MATQTYEQLIAGANKIKENELPESNTHDIVGEQLLQMTNKMQEENSNNGNKFSELETKFGVFISSVQKETTVSPNLDLRVIKTSLKANSILKFRVDLIKGEATTYKMLTYRGGSLFSLTTFDVNTEYILPLVRDFDVITDIQFGAYFKGVGLGVEAKFTYILNYQNSPELPIIDKIEANSLTFNKFDEDVQKRLSEYTEGYVLYNGNGASLTLTKIANKVIQKLYIKNLPSDIGSENRIFLRQITNNYPGIGNQIWLSYKKNDGTIKNWDTLRIPEGSVRGYASNTNSEALLDFSVIPEELGTQPLFNSQEQYIISSKALSEKIYDGIKDSSINEGMLQEDLRNKINSASAEEIGTKLENLEDSIISSKVINKYWHKTVVNDGTGALQNPTDKRKSILIPLIEGDLYTREDLFPAPSFGDGVVVYYSEYPTEENATSVKIGIDIMNPNIIAPSGAKYMLVSVDPTQNGKNPRIIHTPKAFIEDGSIDETKLSSELKAKIGGSRLSDYDMFSVGDSMCHTGVWQSRVVEKTGINFDQALNAHPSHPTSIGGTSTPMGNPNSTYFRTRNLIEHGNIENDGENAIILFENVNDGTFTFNPDAKTYRFEKFIEVEELTAENLQNISSEERTLNTVLKVKRTAAGKVLTVTKVPTKEGNIRLRVGWSGPGVSDYNIHIVPQDTDENTIKHILDKIVEIDYKSVYDNYFNESGVSFTPGNSYPITVEFYDTDNIGMECSITEESSVKYEVLYWFNSLDLSAWETVSNWVVPNASSGWKSSIEEVLRAFPKAKIGIINMPSIILTKSDYGLANGVYDEKAFFEAAKTKKDAHTKHWNEICNLYSIKMLDVWEIFNVTASNFDTFYYDGNIHPKTYGYNRVGDILSGMLKSWVS